MTARSETVVDNTMWSGLLHTGVQGTFLKLPYVPPKAEALHQAGASVAVMGFPWDSSCISRSGASYGPKAIREASDQFLLYNATLGIDLSEHYTIVDCGDVEVVPAKGEISMARGEAMFAEILAAGAVPVMFGGDHAVTIAGVRAHRKAFANPGLVLLDTHFDTAVDMGGDDLSHCCPVARAVDAGFDPKKIAIVGPGGWLNPRSELEYIHDHGIALFSLDDVIERGALAVAQDAARIAGDGTDNIYLTIDIDCLDSAYAPGTGVPTPGGMTSRELFVIIKEVARHGLGAFDIAEVSPAWDKDGITSRVACRAVLDALAANAGAKGT